MRLTCPQHAAPRLDQKRVNVAFPLWMVEQLDLESSRLGVTRQSIIKVWLAKRLERRRHDHIVDTSECYVHSLHKS
jgi:hypothetical protein